VHVSLLQVTQLLERTDIYNVLPRKWVFVHVHDGMRAAAAAMSADGCAHGAVLAAAADSADQAAKGSMMNPSASQSSLPRMKSIPESCGAGKQQQHQHVSIEMTGDDGYPDSTALAAGADQRGA
jgi:hypothetical protein